MHNFCALVSFIFFLVFVAGIPIGVSQANVSLAREFHLPPRESRGTWQVAGRGRRARFVNLPVATKEMEVLGPKQLTENRDTLDRIEARGVGFSEMQSYWSLPFHEMAVVSDVAVTKDQHNRPLFDTVHVASSNPVWLYTMKPLDSEVSRLSLNSFFDSSASRRQTNAIPKVKMATLGGQFAGALAVHDEVSNSLILVDPQNKSVLQMKRESLLDSIKDFTKKITNASVKAAGTPPFRRMATQLSQENYLVFFTPGGGIVELVDLNQGSGVSHSVELPIKIKSLHPLNKDQYLVVAQEDDVQENQAPMPQGETLYMLKKDDLESDLMPSVLTPINQSEKGESIKNVTFAGDKGLTDFGLKCVLDEATSAPNSLFTTSESYATLVLGFPELEFSPNEVYVWPRSEEARVNQNQPRGSSMNNYSVRKFIDPGRNTVFLRDSCQIVRPVAPHGIDPEMTKDNYGITSPGNIAAYLEVVDLMSGKLR